MWENISDTLACGSCATSLSLLHFDVICDLSLKRHTATWWNIFVKHIKKEKIYCIKTRDILNRILVHDLITQFEFTVNIFWLWTVWCHSGTRMKTHSYFFLINWIFLGQRSADLNGRISHSLVGWGKGAGTRPLFPRPCTPLTRRSWSR